MTTTDIQYPSAGPNITQMGTMFEEIKLGLVRHFVPAKKQAVVYVIAPKGAVDPRKRIVVFANFVESSHARKPIFMRVMLFACGKLRPRVTPGEKTTGQHSDYVERHRVSAKTVVATFD